MLFRSVLFLSIVAGANAQALADEADLSTPIAKSPEFTLGDLVPAAILEGMRNSFGLQAEVTSNAAGHPFHATFETLIPDYPNVTISLLVSERNNVTGLIAKIRSMADAGNLPGGSAADMNALTDAECIGIVGQNTISCMVGTAAIQFSATDFMGGDSIDYAAAKARRCPLQPSMRDCQSVPCLPQSTKLSIQHITRNGCKLNLGEADIAIEKLMEIAVKRPVFVER